MNKRVFIIHGWDGYPDEGWFPWLKKELEQKDLKVQIPAMPEPSEPKIEAWVSHLSKIVGEVDENTFFVGHSKGHFSGSDGVKELPSVLDAVISL